MIILSAYINRALRSRPSAAASFVPRMNPTNMPPSAQQARFIEQMRNAGFRVNWLTFLDGTTHPTVYGSFLAVRDKTDVPIQWKPMGNFQVVYPIPENNALLAAQED